MNPNIIISSITTPDVLGAIITAVAGIITSILTWVSGKPVRNARNDLRKEHLVNLYEPLNKLLFFTEYATPAVTRKAAYELIQKQYKYATPKIIKLIKENKNTVSESSLDEIKEVVSSVYNWHLKKLGYSYSRKPITLIKRFQNIPIEWLLSFHLIDVATLVVVLLTITLTILAAAVAFYNLYLVLEGVATVIIVIIIGISVLKGMFSSSNNNG